jgi:hypothetical protein
MKHDQRGAISLLSIFSILLFILFVVAVCVGVVLYNGEHKYKTQSDLLVASAVATAKQQQSQADQKQFAAEVMQPLQAYIGPEAYGTVTIYYPKTYSAYIIANNTDTSTPVNGYFQPGYVPDTTNVANAFALRVQINSTSYDQVLSQFTSLATAGKVTVTPYSLPKVPSVVGVKVVGNIATNVTNGIMIILPLRNTTLQVWTESTQYESNFNSLILPNLSFLP